ADILDKVFDPFFTTKEKGKGTGLGLSTVMGIVKAHNGVIAIDTKLANRTQFSVYLPAEASAQAQQEPLPGLPPRSGHGELILVVDDDASIRTIAKATLEAQGYRVLTAGDGTEAVALYAQHREEIRSVLIDMMMPIMGGPLTIRALRSMNPEVPIIAMSGLMTNNQAKDLGVRVFLRKPYTAQQLLRALAEVVSSRGNSGGGCQATAEESTWRDGDRA